MVYCGRKVILLCLSGLIMMEGILNKEQLFKVPSKTQEAKLKIVGRRLQLDNFKRGYFWKRKRKRKRKVVSTISALKLYTNL